MINYPSHLKSSDQIAIQRQEKAVSNLGVDVVKRILGFALFLFGMNRKDTASYLQIAYGTFLSFLLRVEQLGISAFYDRRRVFAIVEKAVATRTQKIELTADEKSINIALGDENQNLVVPRSHSLQCKVVLLSFLNSGMLSVKEVAQVLDYSERQIWELKEKLKKEDIDSLIDKRKGQTQDYRFTPAVKSELVQQYAAHAITGNSTSSRVLSESIQKRCHIHLPDRSIRLHIQKLGLSQIAKTLPELVDELKKTRHADVG